MLPIIQSWFDADIVTIGFIIDEMNKRRMDTKAGQILDAFLTNDDADLKKYYCVAKNSKDDFTFAIGYNELVDLKNDIRDFCFAGWTNISWCVPIIDLVPQYINFSDDMDLISFHDKPIMDRG